MDLCFYFIVVPIMQLSLIYTEYLPLVYTNIHTHTLSELYISIY